MLTFIVFLVGYTLSQFYRSFLAVIAPELASELSLTASTLGNISAAWFVTFALAQFVVGTLLDRYGPRRTVPIFMMASVAGALLFSQAYSGTAGICAMGLIGLGCAPALMAPFYVFARRYPEQRFAMLSALTIGLGSSGNLLGGTPLALAAEAFGWRSVFVGLAGITFLSAVLIGVLVRDPPPADFGAHTDDGGILAGIKRVLSIKALWPLWPLMTVSYGIVITERGLWVGPYLSEVHGLAPVARGNVIFLMAAAIAAGALCYGPLEHWTGQRKRLVFWGSIISGLCLLVLWLAPQLLLPYATVLLCLFGFAGLTYGPAMAHVRSYLPDSLLGRGMTFANFLCMSGAALLQKGSGLRVDALRSEGLPAHLVFADIHFLLSAILLVSVLVYAFAPERKG